MPGRRICFQSLFGDAPLGYGYAYTVVMLWLFCQAHKLSPLISNRSYYRATLLSSWYDMQSTLAFGWVLISELPIDTLYYWLFSCGSAFVFAELGEVSSLKRIVLRPGFYSELDMTALVVFWFWIVFSALTIVASMFRARAHFSTLVAPFVATVGYYGIGFALLYLSQTSTPSLHLHHAFTAGVLSLWYRPEDPRLWPWWQQALHAICFGIFVQGANYYGTQEFEPLEDHGEEPADAPSPGSAIAALSAFGAMVMSAVGWRCFGRRKGLARRDKASPGAPEISVLVHDVE